MDSQSCQPEQIGSFQPLHLQLAKSEFLVRRSEKMLALHKLREICRAKATKILKEAKNASSEHEYLIQNDIRAFGIKYSGNELIIPFYKNDVIAGIQFIKTDGTKRTLNGTEKLGAFFFIPGYGVGKEICIVVGYAAGAFISEMTGSDVVVAFDYGSLESVAKVVRASHRRKKLIIYAHKDGHKLGSHGFKKTLAAGRSTGAKVQFHTFEWQ